MRILERNRMELLREKNHRNLGVIDRGPIQDRWSRYCFNEKKNYEH